jgi:cell division initiation protein
LGAGYPERREREVKITPLDIRRKEFKRSMRGYADEEVDIFLDEVADEFERIFQENMELQDRAHRLDEQIAGHAQLKDALEKTLISAQLQSEELRANAHKESELILRDAELKARGVVSASYGETQRTQQALVQLKLLEEDFRFKFRSLLEGYLRLLNEAPLAVAAPEAAAMVVVAGSGVTGAAPAPVEPEPAAAVSKPPVHVAEPPAYVPEAPLAAQRPPVAAEAPTYVEERPAPPVEPRPIGSLGDDAPTEESALRVADTSGLAAGFAIPEAEQGITAEITVEEVTAESGAGLTTSLDDESQQAESPQGFFFGRQILDMDDTFPGDDAIKKDKTRDFEW